MINQIFFIFRNCLSQYLSIRAMLWIVPWPWMSPDISSFLGGGWGGGVAQIFTGLPTVQAVPDNMSGT